MENAAAGGAAGNARNGFFFFTAPGMDETPGAAQAQRRNISTDKTQTNAAPPIATG